MSEPSVKVECMGLRCPEPVLRTAKAARTLGPAGGLLRIDADDAAFPLDLKSWCKSASAELVSLEQEGATYRAVVRVRGKEEAAPSAAAPVKRAPAAAPLLDYRGKRCPEPILELAKAARGARGPLEVLADDPAFLLDLRSWCRSSGATMEELSNEEGVLRVRVVPKGASADPEVLARTMEAPTSAPPAAPAPSPAARPEPAALAAPAAPAPRAVEQPASALFPAGSPKAVFDLRTLDAEALEAELQQLGRLRVGTGMSLLVAPALGQRVVRWCALSGHELLAYSGGEQVDLVLRAQPEAKPEARASTLAVVPPKGEYDCALLVMHNDLECLLGALLVANSAAAQGLRTMVFFTFWGLNLLRGDQPNLNAPQEPASLLQRLFKWMMPRGPRRQNLGQLNFGGAGALIMQGIMQKKNILDLPALLASAESQGVSFIACTMSMTVMGISQRELHPYPNLKYGGVASFVEAGRNAQLSLVF